jgi:hypothetical protein
MSPISNHVQLSPNFTLAEFVASDTAEANGIDNTPPEAYLRNMERVACCLEGVRYLLDNKPITITSGYRCPPLNAAVGGADDSAHVLGLAADFVCPEFGDPLAICQAVAPFLEELEIDQLIHENDSWVHIGLSPDNDPRYMAMTINGSTVLEGIA